MAKKTYQAIQAEIQKLQQQADAMRAREVAGVISQIKAAMAEHGITARDLGFGGQAANASRTARPPGKRSSKGKTGRPVKYRDAAGNEWVGMGKRPAWFAAALAAGTKPEELLTR